MEPQRALASQFVRFGTFEVDFRAGELRKNGLRLRLEPKPFEALELLLTQPGELIDRQQFYRILWPGTHVSFDRSLNTIINRLREVLGDSAANPRFVETLSRRGYRFIAPVRTVGDKPSGPIDSIAVLPFAFDDGAVGSAGGTANGCGIDFLGDGLTDALIHTLSQISGLRVLAASAVGRYRGRSVDPSAAARELGVRAVLTGRVSRRGRDLGIVAELVDAADGTRLWGESVQGRLRDMPQMQEGIVRQAAEKLRLRLTADDSRRLGKRHSESPEAYQEYLCGRFLLHKLTRSAIEKATDSFERAIQMDAYFSLAWAGLADCLVLLAFFGLAAPSVSLPRAKQAVLKALAIDDELAEAHASLGAILKAYDRDWPAAEREYRRAIELNPNVAVAHHGYSALLSALGRTEEALAEIRRAQVLDPLSLVFAHEVAWHFYMACQYERAVECSLRTLELESGFAPARHTLGLALEQLGALPEAIDAFHESERISQGNPATIAALGHAYAVVGSRAQASQALARLEQMAVQTYVSPFWLAIVHAGLGQTELALQSLERAFKENDVWLVWMKVEPRLHPLRSEPKFHSLLDRTGLA